MERASSYQHKEPQQGDALRHGRPWRLHSSSLFSSFYRSKSNRTAWTSHRELLRCQDAESTAQRPRRARAEASLQRRPIAPPPGNPSKGHDQVGVRNSQWTHKHSKNKNLIYFLKHSVASSFFLNKKHSKGEKKEQFNEQNLGNLYK